MRVAVIGGAGFVGAHAVQRLIARGHDAAAVSARSLNNRSLDGPCHVAIHMFAMTQRDAELFLDTCASQADRLLVISSGDVYRAYGILARIEPGEPESGPVTEDSALRSVLHPYASQHEYDKILVERTILNAGARNCVLRLPAVYGPGDSHHRIGAWLKRMEESSGDLPIGAHYAGWRWTHGYVENVADAIALAAIDSQSAGQIYNVGELQTSSMGDRILEAGKAFGWRGRLVSTPDEQPYDFRQDLIMLSAKIRAQLGFSEIVSAADGVARTVQWEVESGYAGRPS